MPFVSKKQNAWAHTEEGEDALGGPDKVKEWESATNYDTLPNKAPKAKRFNYAPKTRATFSRSERLA